MDFDCFSPGTVLSLFALLMSYGKKIILARWYTRAFCLEPNLLKEYLHQLIVP